MSGFSVSVTGLMGAQKAIDAVNQNIANSSTPDYKRLDALFTALDYSGPNNTPFLPGGVSVQINTAQNMFVENQLRNALSDAAGSAAQNEATNVLADRIKTTNVEQAFSDFMNATQDLNINPQDQVRQEAWAKSGQTFSTELQALGDAFTASKQTIIGMRDSKQRELDNLRKAMSSITAGPNTEAAKQQIESMQKQVLMLSSSIQGYNEVLRSIIPPIESMYIDARDAVVVGTNSSYGQSIIDTAGGFNYDPNNMGNVAALTEFGSQQFNKDMGVMNVDIGSVKNSESFKNTVQQDNLRSAQKAYQAAVGVDLVQESVKLLEYKRMYEANAKAIAVQDEILGTLLNIFS